MEVFADSKAVVTSRCSQGYLCNGEQCAILNFVKEIHSKVVNWMLAQMRGQRSIQSRN